MNDNDIIQMALEHFGASFKPSDLEVKLAVLAVAAEREACAKVCEELGVHPALNVFNGGPEWYKHGKDCAAAIRARGGE